MCTADAVLKVIDLKKTFKGAKPFVAVDGVSFEIKPGEIVGLLGPNGAGKSTTIQMLLGTMKPSAGEILYFGRNIQEHRSLILSDVGYVNGYSRLPWNLSVYENLQIHGQLYGIARRERLERMEKLLALFGVTAHKHKLMHQLSAGEATRVGLAKAFLTYPKLVLLDEPTAALDPAICEEVVGFIKEQRRRYEVAMLYTSHNMAEVADLCDRVVFLKKGRVLADGTPAELAATGASSRLRLGLQKESGDLRSFFEGKSWPYHLHGNWLEVSLAEEGIPELLATLGEQRVGYSGIEIEKPSLEDYFISVSKGA